DWRRHDRSLFLLRAPRRAAPRARHPRRSRALRTVVAAARAAGYGRRVPTFLLGDRPLDLPTLVALSQPDSAIALGDAAVQQVERARQAVAAAVAQGATVYGINTGFGKLAGVRIAD